jgi:hypothetical protein
LEPHGAPQTVSVAVRRYRCTACRAILVVVPREVAPRKHYSAAAIAWALGLFGCDGLPLREVRRRTSPWAIVGATAAVGWTTLVRWIRAVRRHQLFAGVRPVPAVFTHRQVAARVATTLAAGAGPTVAAAGLAAAAFWGAAQMA